MALTKRFVPSPSLIVLATLLFILTLYLITPITFEIVNNSVLIVILFHFILYFSGIWVVKFTEQRFNSEASAEHRPESKAPPYLKEIISSLVVISTIGIFLRIYDQIFNRALDLSRGITEARLEAIDQSATIDFGGTTILSIFGAFLYSFSVLPFIFTMRWRAFLPKRAPILAIIPCLYPALDSIIKGGITSAVMSVLIIFIVLYSYTNFSIRTFVKNGILFLAAALLVLSVGSEFYKQRVTIFYGSASNFLKYRERVHPLTYNQVVHDIIDYPVVGGTLLSYLWFADYVLQPTSELSIFLYENEYSDPDWGVTQAAVPVKVFYVLTGNADIPLSNSVISREGKYFSALKESISDFGLIGSFFQFFIIGVLSQAIYRNNLTGGRFGMLFYPLTAAMTVQSFLVNPFAGTTIYFIIAGVVTWFLIDSVWSQNADRQHLIVE